MATVEDWIELNGDTNILCPDCGQIYYEAPTTCPTCWCEGGGGMISLTKFLTEIVGYKNEK